MVLILGIICLKYGLIDQKLKDLLEKLRFPLNGEIKDLEIGKVISGCK